MSILYVEGFDFGFDPSACESCHGYCCRGTPGRIWVNQMELLRISGFLKTNTVDCMQQYMHRVGSRVSIRERVTNQDFECVFFHTPTSRCSIYEVRPFQCRRYPFWDVFKGRKEVVMQECLGIRV